MPGSAIRVQIETIPVENPMKKRIVAIVLCCASAALLTSMPLMADDAATAEGAMTAAAEPMDMNAKFEQASEEFWDWARMLKPGEYSGEKHREIAMKCFGDIDFSQLSMENIRQAPQMIGPAEDLSARMQTVLMERAGDASVDGVRAAMLSMQMAEDEDTTKDMLELVLTHPSLDDAIKDGMASELFGTLAYLDPAWLAPMADKLASLGDVMFDAIEPLDARSASSYFEAMLSLRDTIGKERLESIRLRTLGFMNNAIDVAKEENPDMVDWLTGMTEFLDGAFAKGMLLDHPAPAIAFTWANGRHGEITSLDDLKGKVVVLDFWATWCGPCVGSFPNVRELQAFYDGYDVAIIGVTSIQGSRRPRSGASRGSGSGSAGWRRRCCSASGRRSSSLRHSGSAVAHVEPAALVVVEAAERSASRRTRRRACRLASGSPRPGIQHSMSIMSAFFGPRSPVQHWSRR
jgi:thiol-disulfide isomerase/thioredoxin